MFANSLFGPQFQATVRFQALNAHKPRDHLVAEVSRITRRDFSFCTLIYDGWNELIGQK